MRLKGNVEARRHPQNKRAGQGRAGWRSPGCCDVPKPGEDWDCGIQNCRVGKKGLKAPVWRWFSTKDLPVVMAAGRSLQQGVKPEILVLPGPSLLLCSSPPFPLSLASLPAPESLPAQAALPRAMNHLLYWWEGVCHGLSCRIPHGAVPSTNPLFSSPDTTPHPRAAIPHLSISPALMGELWAPPRLRVETSAQATKPCCHFWARSGKMKEIKEVRWGRAAERGAWWRGVGAWLWDLGNVQGVKSKSRRILRCVCCRRGGKGGNVPERQKGLWEWVSARWGVKHPWAPPGSCLWFFTLCGHDWGPMFTQGQAGDSPGSGPPSAAAGARAVISLAAFALH